LYGAVLKLASQPDLWRQMGTQASRSVAQNFEQQQQIGRLESVYSEAIQTVRTNRQ
jgi:hypothetical protein